jgi:hypothetical protein
MYKPESEERRGLGECSVSVKGGIKYQVFMFEAGKDKVVLSTNILENTLFKFSI